MKNLCHYTQSDLKKTLAAIYNNYEPIKYETIETDDYLYVKGLDECPVCLVCHLDTVFEDPYRYYTYASKPVVKKEAEPRRLEWFHDTEKKVLWSPDGAGFDDRTGVYIALMLIDKGADVLFCTDEEVGCLGAKAFCKDYKEFPRKIKYFVELDRAYFQDCVFYNCTNEEFQDYVETFGFIKDRGTYSDIYYLGPHFDVACVNLSVGYFNEHEQIERLYYEYTDQTIEKVKAMLAEAGEEGVPYYDNGPEPPAPPTTYYSLYNDGTTQVLEGSEEGLYRSLVGDDYFQEEDDIVSGTPVYDNTIINKKEV